MRDDASSKYMVLLPDYPTRVVNEHRIRVEKIALLGLLTIIIGGAWWLWPAVEGEADLLSRSSHVFALFTSAILLSDLIDYGPVEKSRIGTVSNVLWPSFIAVAASDYSSNDAKISSGLMLILAVFLWKNSRSIFDHSIAARRLRGMTSMAGLALAIATMATLDLDPPIWAIVIISVSFTLFPDLLLKDEMYDLRKQFSSSLERAEESMMKLRSENTGLEQAHSILTNAREVGWSNPQKGLEIIEEAQSEALRIIAISEDLGDIENDALSAVLSAEKISKEAKSPRKAFEMGLREAELGSLREAETLFRVAKTKALVIIEHWQEAVDSISEAERLLSDISGYSADNIRGILESSKEALLAEDPLEAKQIASMIPSHVDSIVDLVTESSKSLEDAQKAIEALENDVLPKHLEKISDSRKAHEEGNYSLSKGLSESIIRDTREISESSNEVTRALRQRKKLESRFPLSGDWVERLDHISHLSDSSKWSEAASELLSLTSDLREIEAQIKDARELMDFVNSEWSSLSKKIDSNGIDIGDNDRISALREISNAEKSLEKGEVQSCLSSLGKADSSMENLRRKI